MVIRKEFDVEETEEPVNKRFKPTLDIGYSSSEDEGEEVEEENGEKEENKKEEEGEEESENEFALDLSDIEELTKEAEEDPISLKYPMYKDKPVFLKLAALIESNIDLFDIKSSIDLQMNNFSQIEGSKELLKPLRKSDIESIWENVSLTNSTHNKKKEDNVTPIQLFIDFLKSNNDESKSFTDFQRKQRKNPTFNSTAIKSIDFKTKSAIFNKWIKFRSMNPNMKRGLISAIANKYKNSINSIIADESLNSIEWFFINDDDPIESELKTELIHIHSLD